VRFEHAGDQAALRVVNESAFGRIDEANLVENLRNEAAVLLSLVAETRNVAGIKNQIIGHIVFSRMWIDTAGNTAIAAVALAPIAVLPEHQRKGIGGDLICAGLSRLRERGEQIVLVLGHPDYYTRFGFSTGNARALVSPFPPEAFMAIELRPAALDGISGKVRYPAAFGL
jgi:putative acetyltransferase